MYINIQKEITNETQIMQIFPVEKKTIEEVVSNNTIWTKQNQKSHYHYFTIFEIFLQIVFNSLVEFLNIVISTD